MEKYRTSFIRNVAIEERVAQAQKGNTNEREDILRCYYPFVRSISSTVCKRNIVFEDDEFSVALIAFNEAIDEFDCGKGASFLSFSKIVMKRRLIDNIRKMNKEVRVVTFLNDEDEYSVAEHLASMNRFVECERQKALIGELNDFAMMLQGFDISLSELVEVTPKHQDAKENAIVIARTLAESEQMKEKLFKNKRIPMNDLAEQVSMSRKTIERNRVYIISVAVVFSSHLPLLQEFVSD